MSRSRWLFRVVFTAFTVVVNCRVGPVSASLDLFRSSSERCFAIIVEVRSYLLPFTSQHQRAYSPYCSLYISYGNDKENLSIYGELQLEIILFTLVALIYYSVMILYRKITC